MAKESFKQSQAMVCNVEFLARMFGLSRPKLAAVMGISASVLYARLCQPENFQLKELERLAAWSTKKGYPVTLAQILRPFVPAAEEVSA